MTLRPSKGVGAVIAASDAGYRVLPDGSVVNPSGRTLAVNPNGGTKRCPYMRVSCGKPSVFVHQLAAYQKFGAPALFVGVQVRHKDGCSLNNALDNILIGTPAENHADIPEHVRARITGLATTASGRKKRKLSDEQIREVRALHAPGSGTRGRKAAGASESLRATAKRLGVTKGVLRLIVDRVTYRDV